MKYTASRYKKSKLLSAAWYIFILAIAAKLIFIYGSQHPAKHDLLTVNGLVKEVRIGGHGESTSLRIESDRGIHRYSSYFGKVWPGMESIEPGDMVQIQKDAAINRYANFILAASIVFLAIAYACMKWPVK